MNTTPMAEIQKLKLEKNWDKTFEKSEKVEHKKVTFVNHFGISLAADMYTPKNLEDKLPAIAVCGPFGAVKEQCSGLYAQEMATRGFLTIAFDPSFTGESGGTPRYMNSPDINTEDFMAAVDFISSLSNIDTEKIGIIGICGWGGMAINTAAIDVRIKVTASITMYDMSRVTANGYFDENNKKKSRAELRKTLMQQRNKDYLSANYDLSGGLPEKDQMPDDLPEFVKQYIDYYKTKRGYHPRSLNSNSGWITTSNTSLLNTKLLAYANEIESAVLIVHGNKAHSYYMSENAFKLLKGNNKEFMVVSNATHCDLYDNYEYIPFDEIQNFFVKNLGINKDRDSSYVIY